MSLRDETDEEDVSARVKDERMEEKELIGEASLWIKKVEVVTHEIRNGLGRLVAIHDASYNGVPTGYCPEDCPAMKQK